MNKEEMLWRIAQGLMSGNLTQEQLEAFLRNPDLLHQREKEGIFRVAPMRRGRWNREQLTRILGLRCVDKSLGTWLGQRGFSLRNIGVNAPRHPRDVRLMEAGSRQMMTMDQKRACDLLTTLSFFQKYWDLVTAGQMHFCLVCLGTRWSSGLHYFHTVLELDNRDHDGHTELKMVDWNSPLTNPHVLRFVD